MTDEITMINIRQHEEAIKKLKLELGSKIKKCGECGKKLKTKEEKDFGQCDSCCAWKYRDCSK